MFDLKFAVQGFEQDHRPFPSRDISYEYAVEICKGSFFDEDLIPLLKVLGNRDDDIILQSSQNHFDDLLRHYHRFLFADDKLDPAGILDHVTVFFAVKACEYVARE